jgi:hypothetical protein
VAANCGAKSGIAGSALDHAQGILPQHSGFGQIPLSVNSPEQRHSFLVLKVSGIHVREDCFLSGMVQRHFVLAATLLL